MFDMLLSKVHPNGLLIKNWPVRAKNTSTARQSAFPYSSPTEFKQMYDFNLHSHIRVDRFTDPETKFSHQSPSAFALAANTVINTAMMSPSPSSNNWRSLRCVIDRAHKHICGHARLSDMRTIFERNKIWNQFCPKYLSELVRNFKDCKDSSFLRRIKTYHCHKLTAILIKRFVWTTSFSTLSLFYIAWTLQLTLSAGTFMQSTSMDGAIYAMDLCWFS